MFLPLLQPLVVAKEESTVNVARRAIGFENTYEFFRDAVHGSEAFGIYGIICSLNGAITNALLTVSTQHPSTLDWSDQKRLESILFIAQFP